MGPRAAETTSHPVIPPHNGIFFAGKLDYNFLRSIHRAAWLHRRRLRGCQSSPRLRVRVRVRVKGNSESESESESETAQRRVRVRVSKESESESESEFHRVKASSESENHRVRVAIESEFFSRQPAARGRLSLVWPPNSKSPPRRGQGVQTNKPATPYADQHQQSSAMSQAASKMGARNLASSPRSMTRRVEPQRRAGWALGRPEGPAFC